MKYMVLKQKLFHLKELNNMRIKLWDKDNNYIWGNLERTDINLWDKDNNYIWGSIE